MRRESINQSLPANGFHQEKWGRCHHYNEDNDDDDDDEEDLDDDDGADDGEEEDEMMKSRKADVFPLLLVLRWAEKADGA